MTRRRIAGLDGLRGLAALYVVAHHCWLLCFPGYPRNTGPWWTGWLLHGRLAVVFFIVLSGFSLAAGPANNGWGLGGVAGYFRRRARRILPPYWAALALSLLVAAIAAPLPLSHPPSERSILVYGLLLQDFVSAPAPNGAFWSIAVEAALYIAFPILLLIRRRFGAAVTLALVAGPVIAIGMRHPIAYTWQLAPLFTMGLIAAGLRHRPWAVAVAALPPVLLVVVNGSVWTVEHYFWIDLAIGPAIALFLSSIANGRPAALLRLLTTGPMRRLGGCSYSLYLLHMPIVALISRRLVAPHARAGLPTFLLTVLLAVPASVAAAHVFAAVFERPRRLGAQRANRIVRTSNGVNRNAIGPAGSASPSGRSSSETVCAEETSVCTCSVPEARRPNDS